MATLIPTTGTTSFNSTGKRRLAERLVQRLSEYSLSGTVRVGRKQAVSFGRKGQAPIIIKLPTLRDEAFAIADYLASAQKKGFFWGDMVMRCLDWATMNLCASALAQRKLPHRERKPSGGYNPGTDAIQVMTIKVSKGLEFPVVALPGMPAPGEDEKEAARVFYVAATRATQILLITVSGDGGFRNLLKPSHVASYSP